MENLTVVIPYFQGDDTLYRLIDSLPPDLPIIVVDDCSRPPLQREVWMGENVKILTLTKKGYFAGAVNVGIASCETDVLVLNQDVRFESQEWQGVIEKNRGRYAMIGERIRGQHPSFGDLGYIHGTFMYIRRDAVGKVGSLNEKDYPLWGGTAEWQWRAARKGFQALPLETIPGFFHERSASNAFGSSIRTLLSQEPEKESLLIHTPPLLSVIVPCYNYGRYVSDCVNSLIGGKTSLGEMPGQTLQSLEIIIVDDASTDGSTEMIAEITDITKGIRSYRLEKNGGTAKALNYGIRKANGEFITFLSADDMREPESLEALVRCCQANPHSFAYDDIWLFFKDKRIRKWKMEEYDFERLLFKNHVHAGIVFPKAAWKEVGGYPEVMRDGREDWAFNVALGVHGWCGEHVSQYGYLYRRENQNRSLWNTSPEHHKIFFNKIASLYPKIYGGERPMACCGRKNAPKSGASASMQSMQSLARKSSTVNTLSAGGNMAASTGSQGMVRLRYTGKQMTAVWDGSVTHTRYRFGADKPTGWVDKRDAGEKGKAGFLSLKDTKGNFLFVLESESGSNGNTAPTSPETEPQVSVIVGQAQSTTAGEDLTLLEPPRQVGDGMVVAVDEAPPSIVPAVGFPNPIEYNVAEIQTMSLSNEQWRSVYQAELAADRPRKGLIIWLEERLAGA